MKKLYWLFASLFIVLGSFVGIYLIPFLVWLFNLNGDYIIGITCGGVVILLVIVCYILPHYSSKTITYWIAQIVLINALCFVISGGITLLRCDGGMLKCGPYLLCKGKLHTKFGGYILNSGTAGIGNAIRKDTGETVVILINSRGYYHSNKFGAYWECKLRVFSENGREIAWFNDVESYNIAKILENNGYIGYVEYELGE